MTSDVKIIIGANYGDEGKGMATHYFTRLAVEEDKKVLNVLSNGGPQRGHTVRNKNGTFHIYHHLGSGTSCGADTYFGRHFLINPMMFVAEMYNLFYDKTNLFIPQNTRIPKIYFHPNCRWITPWDILANQLIEKHRGDLKHGTCGMGIWETVNRYNSYEYANLCEFSKMSPTNQTEYLKDIRDNYFKSRLKNVGIDIDKEPCDEWYSEQLISDYLFDIETFVNYCIPAELPIFFTYDTIIFENAQGLLLDADNTENYPHVTASKTGLDYNLFSINNYVPRDVIPEIVYVSRTYATRHGAGPFETENVCPCMFDTKDDFMKVIKLKDESNVENEWQGKLRYGRLNLYQMLERIKNDSKKLRNTRDTKNSLFLTHCDEVDFVRINPILDDKFITTIYKSYSSTGFDISVI